jgi:hypothetical protein
MEDALVLKVRSDAPPLKTGRAAVYAKDDDALYYRRADGSEVAISLGFDSSTVWPIGCIFIHTSSTDPNTLLGFGTWVRFGEGRVLVSQNAADADFDTAEETGGSKTHTQVIAEMPVHTHVQDSHNHTQNSHNHTQDAHNHTQDAHNHTFSKGTGAGTANALRGGGTDPDQSTHPTTATNQAATATNQATTATNQATTATNQNTGGGEAMPIMNPYIVVFMWKRTA